MNLKNIMKTRTALEKHTPDNTGKATNTRTSRLYTTALLLISLGFTTVLSQTTQAQPLPVYGHIYGLGVIKDKNQTPYWGEYDTSGQLVTDTKLGLAIDDFAPDNIRIISAIGYNAYRQQYLDHKTQHQDSPHNDYILAKLIRPDDNASDNSLTLQQLDGSPLVLQLTDGTAISLNDYPLRDDSHYLLLNPPTTVVELDSDNNPQDATIALRYLGSALNTIINTQLPLNPTVVLNGHPQENTDSTDNTGNTDNNTVNPDKTTTVMLDTRSGDIRYQSPHNIGYRTAYYTNNQNQDDTIPSQSLALRDQYTDTILNPIAGALIDLNGTQATSLDNGGFQLITAGWYCNWVQQAPLSAEINYQSFNPRRPNKQASFLLWNTIMPPCYTVSYDFINPWAPPVMTLNADNRQIEYTRRKGVYDFRVSLASITGKLNIIGATVVPDETDDGDTNYTRYTDKDYLPTLDTLDNSLSTSVQNALNDNIIYTIYNEDTGEYTHQQLPANGNTNSEAQALIATTGLLDPESDISQANLGYTLQDFDNDGQPDTALIGRIEANPDTTDGAPDLIFNINVDPNAETDTDTDNSNGDSTDPDNPDNNDEPQNPIVQGIYLSSTGSSHANGDLPDITRVPDTNTSLQHQALVNTITETDLYNTDLYLVRQSTGEIVAERNGAAIARDDTLNAQNDNDGINTNSLNGVALDDQLLNFQLMVIGPDSHRDQLPGTNPSDTTTFTQQWQSQNGLNPKYTQRTGVNHLRPGETVKLIAINRATGYIGTKTFTWNNNALNNNTNARLSEDIGTITLLPPNLKIWAERQYTVEKGATQGQTRRYLIGNEGSALQSDTTVTVYTQWLDHDNTPLPQSLGDFGYTGRIAKITEPNKVATLTGSDTTFAIKPGTHIELLRVSDLAITNDHLYIQVNGEPFSRNPSFATDANRLETLTSEQKFETNDIHEGRLKYRPDHFVPFKVNVYDEGSSQALQLAYNQAIQQNPDNTNLVKPDPVYQWLYRPDYQYSVYDLTINKITAQTDPDDEDTIRPLTNDNAPVLGPNDRVFELIYDLAGNENDALEGYSFEGKKDEQLVFALGETELRATVGENQQLQFEDLSQLQHLSPEDYLTLRLYNNNDVANTLWEWAFHPARLLPDTNRDSLIYYDNASEEQQALGYLDTVKEDVMPSYEKPLRIWVNHDDDIADVASSFILPGAENKIIYPDVDFNYVQEIDSSNDTVDGLRDLVDFFPIQLDIQALADTFPPLFYDYRLVQAQGAFNMFAGYLPNDDMTIQPLSNDNTQNLAAFHKYQPTAKAFEATPVQNITPDGLLLEQDFVRLASQGEGGVFFIEATQKTTHPIKLELHISPKNSREVKHQSALWVQPSSVNDMIRHIDLQQIDGLKRSEVKDFAALSDTSGREPPNNPDALTEEHYFVFIHGFNVSGRAASGWHAEIFKRFYRLGFNGRFVGLTWHGDTGGTKYHDAVYNAFISSELLNQRITAITGGKPVTLAAHSLGNVVASNAIAHQGLEVDNYYMINAAVPIEAYDASQTSGICNGETNQRPMKECITEEAWKPYLADHEKLFASNWYDLFEEGDPRRDITWKNRFASVLDKAYNFYSPGEDVVENANPNESAVDLPGLIDVGLTGRHAWSAQEISKGCANPLASFLTSQCQAGWGFTPVSGSNISGFITPRTEGISLKTPSRLTSDFNRPEGDPLKLTNEHIAQYGFFRPFEDQHSALYAPILEDNQFDGSPSYAEMQAYMNDANKDRIIYDLLSSAIPASSFAVAANSLQNIDIERNFNMHLQRDGTAPGTDQQLEDDIPDYWPQSRIKGEPEDYDWFHSDFRNMALPYVYPMYETMLDTASLRTQP